MNGWAVDWHERTREGGRVGWIGEGEGEGEGGEVQIICFTIFLCMLAITNNIKGAATTVVAVDRRRQGVTKS